MLLGCVPTMPPSEQRAASEPRVLAAPERDMQKAVSLEQDKKYADALTVYRQIVTDYPKSPVAADALFAIARLDAFYDNPQKDYTQALAEFEDFDKRYPEHEKAQEARNWQAILKLVLDTKKENARLRKNIDELEKVDIQHEEKRRK